MKINCQCKCFNLFNPWAFGWIKDRRSMFLRHNLVKIMYEIKGINLIKYISQDTKKYLFPTFIVMEIGCFLQIQLIKRISLGHNLQDTFSPCLEKEITHIDFSKSLIGIKLVVWPWSVGYIWPSKERQKSEYRRVESILGCSDQTGALLKHAYYFDGMHTRECTPSPNMVAHLPNASLLLWIKPHIQGPFCHFKNFLKVPKDTQPIITSFTLS